MVGLSALTSSERQRFRPRVDQTTAHIPSQASPAEADCLRHERRRTRGDSKTTTLYQNRLRRINVREGFLTQINNDLTSTTDAIANFKN